MSLFKLYFNLQVLIIRRKLMIRGTMFFAVAIIFLGISGCGFSPMYAQNGDNAELSAKLASVEIKPIKTLIGQEYRNALEDVLDPSHIGAVKEYVMEANLSKNVLPLAIERDRTVTRYKVVIVVDFTLKEIVSGKVISKGQLKNDTDYDRVNSDYATYVSENDTTNRAIREIAQDTKIRIISALLK